MKFETHCIKVVYFLAFFILASKLRLKRIELCTPVEGEGERERESVCVYTTYVLAGSACLVCFHFLVLQVQICSFKLDHATRNVMKSYKTLFVVFFAYLPYRKMFELKFMDHNHKI
jgi:hypothetical protein